MSIPSVNPNELDHRKADRCWRLYNLERISI